MDDLYADLSNPKPLDGIGSNKHHVFILLFVVFSIILISGILFFILWQKRDLTDIMHKTVKSIKISTGSALIVNKKPPVRKSEKIAFLPSWTVSQNKPVQIKQLSQLIYFGLAATSSGEIIKFDANNVAVAEWSYLNSDYMDNIFKEAAANKVKVLLAIKNFDNENIDTLISNPKATDIFIKQTLDIVKEYQLAGINLDFEYFTDSNSNFPTMRYLNSFLEKVVNGYKKENQQLIVSFDVNASAVLVDNAYDMVKIGELVDQVILMAYDYYQPTSIRAGPIAPLYAGVNEHSVSKSVQSLIGRVATEKIILGVPFYGYEWQTVSENINSPVLAGTAAIASYQRVTELINSRDDIKINRDEVSGFPWLTYSQSGAIKQIYYEDQTSLKNKILYLKEKKLGGIAVWALGYEGETTDLWDTISENLY